MKDRTIAGGKIYVKTPRIVLRDWTEKDIAPFAGMNSDPDVMRYFPSILTHDKSREFFDRITSAIAEKGYGLFAAELVETGEFMGFIGFSNPKFEAWFTPCIEIGWRLDKKFWGKGLATEGAAACLKAGFEELGFGKVYSFTSEINIPSRRVMEKIGLFYIGDFDHPNVSDESVLKKHVLYGIERNGGRIVRAI